MWLASLLRGAAGDRHSRRGTVRRNGGRKRLHVEQLEDRRLLSIAPLAPLIPVAGDDAVSTLSNAAALIDVLANDADADGTLDATSLAVASPPLHGAVTLEQTLLASDTWSGPLGYAPGLSGTVDGGGSIRLKLTGYSDDAFTGNHDQLGQYVLFVRLGQSDFSTYDPAVFDFRFDGSLAAGEVDSFTIPGQSPAAPFVAWVDQRVGPDVLYTQLGLFGLTGRVAYTPATNFHGDDLFTYTVRDNDGLLSNAAAVTVTVVNRAPLAADDTFPSQGGAPLAIDVLANDADPDGLLAPSTLEVTALPSHGTAMVEHRPEGTVIVYTPGSGFAGADVFSYTVRDNDGAVSSPASVRLSKLAARDDAATVPNDANAVAIDVLANDSGPGSTVNPASLKITVAPEHGVARVFESQSFLSYKDQDTLEDFSNTWGRDPLDFSYYDDENSPLGDGHASALSGVVDRYGHLKLRVTQYADVTFLDGFSGPLGVTVTGDYALFVRLGKSDFTDFAADAFDYQFRDRLEPGKVGAFDIPGLTPDTPFIAWIDNTVGSGTPDTMMINAGPNVIVYKPDVNFVGTDVLRYTVEDTDGNLSTEGTVTITVLRPPLEVSDGALSTHENTPVEVVRYDDAAEGTPDPHTITVTSQPLHGTVSVLPTDTGPSLLYTPDPGFTGRDVLRYTVNQPQRAESKEATVTIDVVDVVNAAPVAVDDTAAADANQPATIDVLANDVDTDGTIDATSLTIVSGPSHGTAVVQQTAGGSVVVYTPDPDFLGTDAFRYTVRDDNGALSNEALVTVNPPPVAGGDSASTTEGAAVGIRVLENDVPFDFGAPLMPYSITITSPPARGTAALGLIISGFPPVVYYTPNPGAPATLVVDEWSDADDGNYSLGHLSLREAINLAAADRYTDVFSYTVQDVRGIVSNEATVTVAVAPGPTTIVFAPGLTAGGPRTLRLSQVADPSEDNSALAIQSAITIIGPSGGHRITLAGPGSSGDLRLFLVPSGGSLALEDLTLSGGATDAAGGAILVENGGTATLHGCTLADNFAFDQGGAIYNAGTTTLVNCEFRGNRADQGAAVANLGTLSVFGSTLAGNAARYDGGGLFNSGSATLATSTLSANTAERGGGGIFNLGTATLTYCTLAGNQADQGGGFANGAGTPVINPLAEVAGTATLTRTTLSDNTARQGGGVYNLGELTLVQSTVAQNRARQGGGLFNSEFAVHTPARSSTATLTASTVSGNRADEGAGLDVDLGLVTIADSTIADNTADGHGGGILNNAWTRLTNATLAGNAAQAGGGLYNGFGSATIAASTLSANTAKQGGGLWNDVGYVLLTDTIVAGNRRGSSKASDIGGPTPVDTAGSMNNLIGTGGSGGLDHGTEGNLVGVDPLLSALGDYGGPVSTFALLPGSPALDAGGGDGPDARGVAPVGRRDIGAFESHGFQFTASRGSGQEARVGKGFRKPLQVTVSAVDPVEPVVGGTVTFSVPDAGASARLKPTHATIGPDRTVSVTARANNIAGTYTVTAGGAGVATPASFVLTNVGSAAGSSAATVPAAAEQPAPAASAASSADQAAVAAAPLSGYTTLPADTTEYRLAADHRLLQRPSGGAWTVLDRGVVSFAKAPNGDLYLLSDRQELKRLKLGYFWETLQSGVVSIAMDAEGTVYALDNLTTLTMYASLDRYYVLPAASEGSDVVSLDPPDEAWVMRAAHTASIDQIFPGSEFPLRRELEALLGAPVDSADASLPADPGASFKYVRITVDPLSDSIDPPRLFPAIGMARVHHAAYVAVIFCTTPFGVDGQFVIYLNQDHLHLVSPGLVPPGMETVLPQVSAAGPSASTASPDVAGRAFFRDNRAPALATGPDGTIYKFGVLENGQFALDGGSHAAYLWRLAPGGAWESLFRAYAIAVAPDNTLYTLTESHELQSQAPGSTEWTTLERNVLSFVMAPDGTLYALTAGHVLEGRAPGAAAWSALDSGVQSLAMTSDGTVYEFNDRGKLRRLNGLTAWKTLDTGVRSMAMVGDVLYEVNGRHEFKRLTDRNQWKTLAEGVQSLARAPDDTIYALSDGHELKRLEADGRLTLIDIGVVSYGCTPNSDLYLLNDRQELKRLKLGYSWSTVASGVESFTIDVFGTVFTIDRLHQIHMFASLDRYHVLPEIPPGVRPIAFDTPSELEAVVFSAIESERSGGQGRLIFPDALWNDVQYFPPGTDDPFAREDRYLSENSAAATLAAANTAPAAASDAEATAATYPKFINGFEDQPYREYGEMTPWNKVRIVVEPISDTLDPPRLFPNVGLAQLHHAQYKIMIYAETIVAHPASSPNPVVNEDELVTLYFDHDHLHRYVAGTPQAVPSTGGESAAGVEVAAAFGGPAEAAPSTAAAAAAPGPAVQRLRDEQAAALTTAPDGTIYKLGGGQTGFLTTGSEPAPYFLWRLRPDATWESLDYVYAFAVGPDSRLYILDTNHVLRTPALGPAEWAVLATDVQSFGVAKDGTLFALGADHALRTRAPGAKQWSTLAQGVPWLAQSPAGTIYAVNDRGELQQLVVGSPWKVLDRGVQFYAMVDDGAIYELNGSGQLKRLREGQAAALLARQVTAMQVAPDGGVYALNAAHELMRLTARDHWTLLDQETATFEIAPNGDLYLISTGGELKRQKQGYAWATLQAGVQSMTIYADGSVTVFDAAGKRTVYGSVGPYWVLGPVAPGSLPVGGAPPSDGEVLRAANLRSSNQVFAPESLYPLGYENETPAPLPDVALPVPVLDFSRPAPPRLRSGSVSYPIPELLTVRNIRIVTEPKLDKVDPPRAQADVGLVSLHRIQYKVTIFYTTEENEDEQLTLFLDHDHWHFVAQI